jgi:Peptidase family M1 domain
MKKQTLLAIIIFISTGLFAQEQPFYHRAAPAGNDITPETSGTSGTGANINVLYHKVYWRINPDSTKYIKGWVQTNFKTIQAAVSTITFDLRSVLLVDSVRFRGAALPAGNITRSGNILSIALGATLDNDFIDSLTIYYRGVPPAVSGAAQGYQRASNGRVGNFITTLSESYEDRDWWPCKADMQDKIDSMDITVSVPWGSPTAADTFWVACNGKLVDSAISAGSRNFTFKTRYPIASYLVAVSVAKYNRYYRSVNVNGTNTQVVYNIFRNRPSYTTILSRMDTVTRVLSAFSAKFADYPFKLEKHGFYDGLLGAGGMEHQTFSGIDTSLGSLTNVKLLVHELMHQWFGDNVTFSTWNDLWLAEGFARYSEALAGELVPGTGINPYTTRAGIKSSALSLSSNSAWIPNGNSTTSALIWSSNYGSTVYERGAMIVSMLRAICGDAKFYEALTNYQTNMAGRSATTDSLKNYFNAVLNRDISPFFSDYVGGSGNGTITGGVGNPINTVNWNSPAANKLVVQMGTQTRSAGSNVTYFRGPVVLHVKGALATQDTTITFFDWGSGNLSFAGNGVSIPVSGNRLTYYLSFTPTTVAYDDSARTLSTGSTVNVPGLDGYTWFGTSSTAWNTAANWSGATVPPGGADVTIATTGSNQPVLPGSITVGPLTINGSNTVIMNGNTLTLNNVIRGTGTLTGSPTSRLVIEDAAGTINFAQTSASTRSLNLLILQNRSSATLGTGLLDIYGGLTVPPSAKLDVKSANLTILQ